MAEKNKAEELDDEPEDNQEHKHKSESKLKKKKNITLSLIIGIVLGILAGIIIINLPNQSLAPAKLCRDVQVPYDDVEYYTDSEPYTDQQCDSKILVYSITDFNFVSSVCNNRIEECTSYTLGFCTNKNVYCADRTVICSVRINNLDDERGSWTINFNFMKSGNSNMDASTPASLWLYPHTSDTLFGSGRITIKEAFDTQYSCSYSVLNEPTKQICHDVIRYRDVQKQRTVTKYRTEQKCE